MATRQSCVAACSRGRRPRLVAGAPTPAKKPASPRPATRAFVAGGADPGKKPASPRPATRASVAGGADPGKKPASPRPATGEPASVAGGADPGKKPASTRPATRAFVAGGADPRQKSRPQRGRLQERPATRASRCGLAPASGQTISMACQTFPRLSQSSTSSTPRANLLVPEPPRSPLTTTRSTPIRASSPRSSIVSARASCASTCATAQGAARAPASSSRPTASHSPTRTSFRGPSASR